MLSISVAILLAVLSYVPTFADSMDTPAKEPMNVEYLHVNSVTASLSITGGTAHVGVTVSGIPNHTTKIETVVTLQRKSGNSWVKDKRWNKSVNDYMLIMNKSKSVTNGTYRVKCVTKAYHNADYETITKYSGQVTY